jgi:hypothetical protein
MLPIRGLDRRRTALRRISAGPRMSGRGRSKSSLDADSLRLVNVFPAEACHGAAAVMTSPPHWAKSMPDAGE